MAAWPASRPEIVLLGCSNGLDTTKTHLTEKVARLEAWLQGLGFAVRTLPTVWAPTAPGSLPALPARERARLLWAELQNPRVQAILDPTGGDLANQVLPWLPAGARLDQPPVYFGFSDNSVMTNGLAKAFGVPTVLFQPLNLVDGAAETVRPAFLAALAGQAFRFPATTALRGALPGGLGFAGGNLRCLTKLAGTAWWPDFSNRIVLLEAWGGDPASLASNLVHLGQLGVWQVCRGILLGTFSKMEKSGARPDIASLVLEATADFDLPVAKAAWFGHGEDALPVPLFRTFPQ